MTPLNGITDSATPRRADFRVLRTVPTRWSDNDHYGHVNNVASYSYFDAADRDHRHRLSRAPAIGIVAERAAVS